MHTTMKVVIAVVIIVVFALVYLAFIGGATGGAGSFLDNIWKALQALMPFK